MSKLAVSYDTARLYANQGSTLKAKATGKPNDAYYYDDGNVITMPLKELVSSPSLYATFLSGHRDHIMTQIEGQDFAALSPLRNATDYPVIELNAKHATAITKKAKEIFTDACTKGSHAVAWKGEVFALLSPYYDLVPEPA